MLIAEENDRKREDTYLSQIGRIIPKLGVRVGHAARWLYLQHAPSAQAVDPREPFVFLTTVFMQGVFGRGVARVCFVVFGVVAALHLIRRVVVACREVAWHTARLTCCCRVMSCAALVLRGREPVVSPLRGHGRGRA
jgi:hypothetical protein